MTTQHNTLTRHFNESVVSVGGAQEEPTRRTQDRRWGQLKRRTRGHCEWRHSRGREASLAGVGNPPGRRAVPRALAAAGGDYDLLLMSSGRMPTASEVLDVMDRLERDPERRIELSQSYDIFRACVGEGILGEDSIDWLAQRMQQLHGEELIAHGPVNAGVREPPVWDGQWIQMMHEWRVTSRGRQDVHFTREAAHHASKGQETVGGVSPSSTDERDVFISHASEDKDAIARPLAEELRTRGHSVWFDEFELTLGDSLRGSIDRGLAESRFGLVILSPSFFAKQWPQRELDGLTTREIVGSTKVILPVWHEVDQAYVAKFSPPLADKLAVPSTAGIPAIADQIERALAKALSNTAELSVSVATPVKPDDGQARPSRLKIPSTSEEQARVVAERPEFWEFLLYAGILVKGKRELDTKWDDHELRLPCGPRREFDLASANDFLSREIGWIKRRIALDRIISPSIYEQAFGAAGQSGDPTKIEGMARRLISTYESWLDWAAGLRNTSVPPVYEEVLEATACLIDGPVVSVREFIDHVADQTARLPELAADGTDEHPITLTFELKLDIEDEVVERNNRAWDKLRSELASND
jgi:hypothetical protein